MSPQQPSSTVSASSPPSAPSLPHKNTFHFDHFGTQITIDSNFDSGNLSKAIKTSHYQFSLWTASDCQGTPNQGYPKSWFYFSVKGFQNTKITFSLHRLHVLWALLKSPGKYRPVYRINLGYWRRLETEIKGLSVNKQGELVMSFEFLFASKNDKVEFAYTYPYTYEDCQNQVRELREGNQGNKEVFFRHYPLVKSVENRNIDLIMISSHEGKDGVELLTDPHILKQHRLTHFKPHKPIILITARVHPLQTPSSHCMTGILNFLLNRTDARSHFLRKHFVFLLIPMLNPDGVAHGHCRMDTLNQNLNRYYKSPSIQFQPSCYAIRKLTQHYTTKSQRLFLYTDLHAHPANKGNFLFGNALSDFVLQVESTLFPKLLSQNCVNFQFQQCNFSRKHMKARDRFEGMNKEGCGRVVLYREFGVVHSYTVECGYHSNTKENEVKGFRNQRRRYRLKRGRKAGRNGEVIYQGESLVEQGEEEIEGEEYVGLDYDPIDDPNSQHYKSPTPLYTQATFHNLGKNILVTILDLWGKNPYPRVDDPNQLRKEIAGNQRKLDRFKKQQNHLKTKQKNIVQLIQQQYYAGWMKKTLRQLRAPGLGLGPGAMIQPQAQAQRALTVKVGSFRRREESEVGKESKEIKDIKDIKDTIQVIQPAQVPLKQVQFTMVRYKETSLSLRRPASIRIKKI